MTINEITTAISTIGFPIVACAALYYLVVKYVTKMTEAINNNTIALTKLVEKIEA